MDVGQPPGERVNSNECPVAAALSALTAAVDALVGAEFSSLPEPQLVAALDAVERQTRRLPSVRDALVAQVQRREVASSHGYRSTGAWLQARFLIGRGEARAWLRCAERLTARQSMTGASLEPVLPAVAAARSAGHLSTEHVKVIDDLDDELPADLSPAARQEVEQSMVAYAQQFDPAKLTRLGQRLLDAIDPDGTEPKTEEVHRRRGITIGPLRRGLARISGHVDAWTREAILAVLASLVDPDPSPSAATGQGSAQDADRGVPSPQPDGAPGARPDGAVPPEVAPERLRPAGAPDARPDSAAPVEVVPEREVDEHRCDSHGLRPPLHGDHTSTTAGDPPAAARPPVSDDGPQLAQHGGPTGTTAADPPGPARPPGAPGPSGDQVPRERPLDADRRTHPQRLHDALRQLCERHLADGRLPRRGGTAATILLTVPLTTLERRTGYVSTAHGGDIPIREVIRRAADASFVPIVLDPVGNPLYVGRRHRLANRQQRHALHVRDGGCVIPGCTTPSQDCQTHHLHDWADGGRTDVNNLALLCDYHHHRIQHFTLRLRNGRIWCTAAPGLSRQPGPQLNTYFRGVPAEFLFDEDASAEPDGDDLSARRGVAS